LQPSWILRVGRVWFPSRRGRGGEKLGAVEDVADEDLAEMGPASRRGQDRCGALQMNETEQPSQNAMQRRGKAAGRFSGRGGRERIDELGDLGLVGIADDPGDTGEGGQFFGARWA